MARHSHYTQVKRLPAKKTIRVRFQQDDVGRASAFQIWTSSIRE